jgi:hypothetical protein
MRLISFEKFDNYIFKLYFEDGTIKEVNLESLLKDIVSLDELDSANIDKDWGCLEFKNGLVDIEPKTLYKFSLK